MGGDDRTAVGDGFPARTCLDENQVLAFIDGRSAPEQLRVVEEHVDECALCQELVALVVRQRGSEPAGEARVDRFQLLEAIGHGGAGIVYRARDTGSGQLFALKTVQLRAPELLASIRREVQALVQLRHPGIVRIVEHGVTAGRPWYAMELLEGETLADLRRRLFPATSARAPAAGGQLARVLGIARRLCEPLAYLHGEGIVHRDLKPQNVLLRPGDQPVLVDFGLVGLVPGALGRENTEVPRIDGTPAYMAPEQIAGELVDARTDLYAFGCLLYELVAGRPPFVGNSPAAILSQHLHVRPPSLSDHVTAAPAGLERLLAALLAKAPRERLGYFDEVTDALEALGASGEPAPLRPRRACLYRPALRGREAVLDELAAATGDAGGGMALIFGESGIGKSYLAAEVARRCRGRRTILHGACLPFEGGADGETALLQPLHGFLDALADRCIALGDEAAGALLGTHGPILGRLSPRLRELVGVELAAPTSPEAARDQLLGALRAMLHAFAEERPLLLVLDDLHWADELTLRLLGSLSSPRFAGVPLFVLGTCRSEERPPELASICARPSVRSIELGRLDAASVGSLVVDMLAWPDPPAAFVEVLARQSEGNPFFVAEYLRTAVTEGLVRRFAGGWHADVQATVLALPPTLRELVGRRLQHLSPFAAQACAAAAVLGRDFEAGLLPRSCGLDEPHALDAVAELLRRQVLEPALPGRLRFVHHKLQEIAYERIARPQLRSLHRDAAVAIEHAHGGDAPAQLGALATHWAVAGELARARQLWERDGDHALGVAAYERAARSFREALALGVAVDPARRAHCQLGLGRACFGLGDLDGLEEHAHGCLESLGRARPRSRTGWATLLAREMVAQLGHLVAVQPVTGAQRQRLGDLALAASFLGQRYFYLDDALAMSAMVLLAMNASERSGAAVPRAYSAMGGLMRLGRARRLSARYFSRAQASGDAAEQAMALSIEAVVEGSLGKWQRACAIVARLEQLLPLVLDPVVRENVLATLCHVEFFVGRHGAAARRSGELLASARQSANAQHTMWGLYFVARDLCHEQRWAEAVGLLEEARSILRAHPETQSEINCCGLMALACLRLGRHDDAEQLADAALARIEHSSPTGFPSLSGYAAVCEVYRTLGCGERWRRMRRALWRFALPFPVARPVAWHETGQAERAAGRGLTARACFALGRRQTS